MGFVMYPQVEGRSAIRKLAIEARNSKVKMVGKNIVYGLGK